MSTEYDFLGVAREITKRHSKALADDPTLAERLDKDPELQELHAKRLCEGVEPRRYDLHYEYTSYAPLAERWSCVDLNSYDPSPGASDVAWCIGRGISQAEARQDLLDRIADCGVSKATPKAYPKASTPVYRGSAEPDDFGRDEGDLFDESDDER